jgi:hypothetical protein
MALLSYDSSGANQDWHSAAALSSTMPSYIPVRSTPSQLAVVTAIRRLTSRSRPGCVTMLTMRGSDVT